MKLRADLLVVVTGIVVALALTGCKRKSDQPKVKPQSIHEAAKRGDRVAAEKFLAQGVQINTKNEAGLTPLHLAAWHGRTEVMELLLACGANIHAKCREAGMTPLHYAAAFGQKEAAELLIANGAEVDAKNKRGGTPLGNAAMGTGRNREVAELLIANGADVNTRNLDGRTPLHKAVISGQPAIVGLLLSKGANMNVKDNYDKTPLERAIILSETRFRRGSAMAKRKKHFEACVQILREHEEN